MSPPSRFRAKTIPSYERPGKWYWHVVDTVARGEAADIVDCGYAADESSAEAEALEALARIRRQAK